MELLKSCHTNAQAIGEFEAVAFQAFSVARNPIRSSTATLDWDTLDHVRAAEAELRHGNHLVLQDASRPWLWLFRAVSPDQVGQQPSGLPTLEDFSFHREQHGVVKAQELEHRPMRSARNTPLSASAGSPMTLRPNKGSQSGSSQQSQGNNAQLGTSEQQQHDAVAIYELFTSAVVALISFHLVKDYNAVALNFRTFASSSVTQQDPDFSPRGTRAPLRLTNVDVFWATAGTLVVSTFTVTKPDMHCLDAVTAHDEQNRLVGTCVRVAPNGILAKIISFADPVDAATEDVGQRLQRKRPKVHPLEKGIERWKASVKRWLVWKGYSVPFLERKDSWVRIQFAQSSMPISSSPAFPRPAREILWPRALCFYYSDPAIDAHLLINREEPSLQGADALSWFETSSSKGFRDPIDLAQQWFLGKAERDKVAEDRRKAKKAEEDAARGKEENHGLLPSSPLNARAGTYGDLQSVSGVYPTPPDVLPPGTAVSNGDTPSVSGLAANVILAPGSKNPAINLSVPQETIPSDAQRQPPPTSPTFDLQCDDYTEDVNNDDLFEDLDEGNFDERNGVTDADFNFFDDPDGEDVTMPDAPDVDDTREVAKEPTENEEVVSTAPHVALKEEPPDPMAALEYALVSASADTEKEQKLNKWERAAPNLVVETQNQSSSSQDDALIQAPKVSTPPLRPRFIESTLLPSPEDKTPHRQHTNRHQGSVFHPLSFSRKMSLSDAKYKAGRFGFVSEKPSNIGRKDEDGRPKSLRDLPLMTKLRYATGVASARSNLDASDSDNLDSSSEDSSEGDDEVDDPGPRPFAGNLVIPIKRKLPTDGHATPLSATSFADSFGGDFGDLIGLQTDETALVVLEPTVWDWSSIDLPPPTELPLSSARYSLPFFAPTFSSVPSTPTSQPDLSMHLIEEKPLSGKDNIAIAQIVTSQIASATLDILREAPPAFSDRLPSEVEWHRTVKKIFPKAVECTVADFAAIQDAFPDMSTQMKAQQRPPPRRPNDTATALGHHMCQLQPPFIRVRRGDGLWDLLPSAIPFWEPLGLAPCSSSKNVVAFGIYPYSGALTPCVESFLMNMQLAYDSCKLGIHARSDEISEYAGGLVPCKISKAVSTRIAFKALRDTCVQLGKLLAAKHSQMRDKDDSKIDAFVIYMIDPFGQPSAIWELCSAFWSLFQSYQQGPTGRPDQVQKPDLVLQIVPIKYVASSEAPVILDSSVYTSLAREVYDRCPPSAPSEDKLPLNIYSAPSFQLEEPIPRNIPFKLTADTPQDLMRENSYMHIGYAISLDGTWITVAWSDTCGKSQTSVSYNLGTRPFADIAKEIWQTTIDILQVRRVTWRVCIAKAGVMDRDELEAWVFLASCPTVLNLFTTLLTVDTEPRLKFTPTAPNTNTSDNPSTAGHPPATTPGSTPQAVASPEQGLTPAATPSVDNNTDLAADPDARLVDMTDETWGIILAHRIHNSNSTTEYRPALISGLLCKRGLSTTLPAPPLAPDPLAGPLVTGVNILWMGAVNSTRAATSPFPAGDGISPGGGPAIQSPSPGPQERGYNSLTWTPTPVARAAAENLLKEILGQFRGLGLLARLKGVKGCRHGTVPWHVAVAVRVVKGLGQCLPT